LADQPLLRIFGVNLEILAHRRCTTGALLQKSCKKVAQISAKKRPRN